MAAKRIVEGLHQMTAGGANTYLLEGPDGLTLVDTGFPGKEKVVLDAIRDLHHQPSDLRHIVLTHAHYDHIGGLAALKEATGAQSWIHRRDASIAESGRGFRPLTPAPGLLTGILFRLFVKPDRTVAPAKIDHLVEDGDVLPVAGGLVAVWAPGHCAGQIGLLWPSRGVLFAGDVCMNLIGLGPPVGYEDEAEGRRSQRKLGALDFEIACFGHGNPITRDAKTKWLRKWGD